VGGSAGREKDEERSVPHTARERQTSDVRRYHTREPSEIIRARTLWIDLRLLRAPGYPLGYIRRRVSPRRRSYTHYSQCRIAPSLSAIGLDDRTPTFSHWNVVRSTHPAAGLSTRPYTLCSPCAPRAVCRSS
jgi:hypothetical protein